MFIMLYACCVYAVLYFITEVHVNAVGECLWLTVLYTEQLLSSAVLSTVPCACLLSTRLSCTGNGCVGKPVAWDSAQDSECVAHATSNSTEQLQ